MNKSHRFSITSWNQDPTPRKMEMLNFFIWQLERTKEGKLHYQAYVEFKNAYTISQVKNIFKDKTMHVEIARKSREMNMLYCLKSQSYAGKRFMYNPTILFGTETYTENLNNENYIPSEEEEQEAHNHFQSHHEEVWEEMINDYLYEEECKKQLEK